MLSFHSTELLFIARHCWSRCSIKCVR